MEKKDLEMPIEPPDYDATPHWKCQQKVRTREDNAKFMDALKKLYGDRKSS